MTEENKDHAWELMVWALYQTGYPDNGMPSETAMEQVDTLLAFIAEDTERKMQVLDIVTHDSPIDTRIAQAAWLYEALNKRLEAQ